MIATKSGFLRSILPALALVMVLMLAMGLSSILGRHFPDPDDALRLLEVRDWLGGQGWFDLAQHRLDPLHGGVMMHWSRLVDMPLAAVILLLRPLLGSDGAEMAARIVVPLVTLAVVSVLMARIAWQRLNARATATTCLMLAISAPFVQQVLPMRIDHHGWQVACSALALCGLLARRPVMGAWLAGLAMALNLEISVEGLPLAAAFAAVAALRWLRGEQGARWLPHYMAALAGTSLILFAGLRGFGDLAEHCDQMSPVHLTVLAVAALGVGGAVLAGGRWPVWLRVAVLGLLGAVAGGLYLGMAPQCRAGSFGMLSPLVRALWYNQVVEGLPIWQQTPAVMLQIALPPLFALYALVRLSRQSQGEDALAWRDYALVVAAAQLVALMVERAADVAGAFCAVPLAWLMLSWLDKARASRPLPRLGLYLVMALVLLPSTPFTLYSKLKPAPTGPIRPVLQHGQITLPQAQHIWACQIASSSKALAAQPAGLVLSGLDIAPELLLATHHSVLASGHHRGARAMDATMRILLARPDQAHARIRQEHIDYVAMCPLIGEFPVYALAAPQGLGAALLAGHAPDWLAPIPGPADPRLKAWRVVK